MAVPLFKQETEWTCGPACIRMILASFRIKKSEKALAKMMKTTKKFGTDDGEFPKIAEKFELEYIVGRKDSTISELKKRIQEGYKIIVCYFDKNKKEGHYAVVKSIDSKKIHLVDPEAGKNHHYTRQYFKKIWYGEQTHRGWYVGIKK